MVSRSAILAALLGIGGCVLGGVLGMYGALWAAGALRWTGGAGVAGEHAFPYGFGGSILGLILGAWMGFHFGCPHGGRTGGARRAIRRRPEI